jgi:putative transposase
MPRRPRLRLADLPLHVIQRGNNRAACFFAEDDYRFYLHHLGELAGKTGCAVHAYVMMTNHVHLLLTPRRPDAASRLMQRLGQRYVQYVNKTYKRSGTLWEGRFKASLVQVTDYFLKCQRYIELNPVRADMVAHPQDYPWSSYPANAEGKPSALITPHAEHLALGSGKEDRQEAYQSLFRTELDPEDLTAIRRAANGGYALGDTRFKEEVEAMLNRRAGPGIGGRPIATPRRDERQSEMF